MSDFLLGILKFLFWLIATVASAVAAFVASLLSIIISGLIGAIVWIAGMAASLIVFLFTSALPFTIAAISLALVAFAISRLWASKRLSSTIGSFAERVGKNILASALFLLIKEEGQARRLFFGTQEDASRAAEDRREFLLRGDQAVEIPPLSISVPPVSVELPNPMPTGLAIDRKHQLESDPLLLFARACDAADFIAQQISHDVIYDVALRKLRWQELRADRFPWTVVIATDHPGPFKKAVLQIREWLGIGVEIRKPFAFTAQRCKHSEDRGTVAGAVVSDTSIYPLTCAHVIPGDCKNLRLLYHRGTLSSAASAHDPDVTLLHDHDCLEPRDKPRDIAFATLQDVENAFESEFQVRRLGGFSPKNIAKIKYDRTTYKHKGEKLKRRFATCIVEPELRKWYFWCIPWPFWNPTFSRPSDSGSWVILDMEDQKRPDLWLGVVVAGDGIQSCVNLAYALVPFLEEKLNEGVIKQGYWED